MIGSLRGMDFIHFQGSILPEPDELDSVPMIMPNMSNTETLILKFQDSIQGQIKMKTFHELQLSTKPLNGTFYLVVVRTKATSFPIKRNDKDECPFDIIGAENKVKNITYGGNPNHIGRIIEAKDITSIRIKFFQPGTYLSQEEKNLDLKCHQVKAWRLLLFSSLDKPPAYTDFQVVVEPRITKKRKMDCDESLARDTTEKTQALKDLIDFISSECSTWPIEMIISAKTMLKSTNEMLKPEISRSLNCQCSASSPLDLSLPKKWRTPFK